jgi:spore maturation protein B
LILLSKLILPILVIIIIIYALLKKINIYESFIKGSKEGIEIVFNLSPYMLAMIFSITLLIKSNFIVDFFKVFEPLFNILKIPIEIIPMSIIRPISGTASLGLMNDIFTNYGVDSYLGFLASTIQGSTDTTIYILALYFGSIGITKIRYAMWVGLLSDLIGVIVGVIIVNILYI